MQAASKILYGGLSSLDRLLKRPQWAGVHSTILLDTNTFNLCLPHLIAKVEALQDAYFIEVPAGEECKSLEVASQVWSSLLDDEAGRDTLIVNLGGGAVCDLGGFVAASYKRGVHFVNVPTTLLAMVDASIGGKTAVNFGGVKNSIGHFYPPDAIIIDTAFCRTLAPDQLLCGKMEMMKTAAVASPSLYHNLMQMSTITRQSVKEVARLKSEIVKKDPFDLGIRKILNFGHTFGHAIELFSHLPHGYAVGIGMMAAMKLSVSKTGLPMDVYRSYSKWLKTNITVPAYSTSDTVQMLALMRQDKKALHGTVRCVLLQDVGRPVVDVEVTDDEMCECLTELSYV